MAIALVSGQRVTATASTVTSISATFAATPTVGNLMLATCCGVLSGWSAPSGWTSVGVTAGANLDIYMFYRQVQSGDGKTYTFSQTGGTDNLEIEMEEWGGFPGGTIGVDLHAIADNASATIPATISPGTTTTAIELVKAAVGVGGSSTTGSPVWNNSLIVDSAFLANQLATGHIVTSATQSFSPTTVTWTGGAHSSTMVVASFAVTSTSAIALVAGQRATNTVASGTTIAATLAATPTVNNLMLATCCGSTANWTAPAGWTLAVTDSTNLNVAIFYRQVQTGDGKTYTFTEGSVADQLELELEEWTGFGTGTIGVDLKASGDAGPALTVSASPGTTTKASELVKAAVGIGGSPSGATVTGWNNGLTIDSASLGAQLGTGHVVTTSTQSFSPTTVTWSSTIGSHSSTLVIASFTIINVVPNEVQRVTATNASASSIGATFTTAPAVGNMLLATCCGSKSGWTAPAGWLIAGARSGHMDVAIFYRRVVQGDTVGPYTFAESGGPGSVVLELEEWAGMPGTPVAELVASSDNTSATSASVALGSITSAVELVKAAVGIGGSTATQAGTPWNQGLTVDSALPTLLHQLQTGHVVTAATQSFTSTTATWVTAEVSTLVVVAFAFVPYQTAIAIVYRLNPGGFATGQPAASTGTETTGAAANAQTQTNTVNPPNASLIVGFAATVNTSPGSEASSLVGGTQRVAAATSGQGLNPALVIADASLIQGGPVTWTFSGSNPYSGGGEIVALSTVAGVPPAPVSVTGSSGPGAGQITVSWASAGSGGSALTGFVVNGAPGGPITVAPSATSLTISGLTQGTAYSFTVTATNSLGASPASASTGPTFTPGPTSAPTTAPTGVTATTPGTRNAVISFTGISDASVDLYRVTIYNGGLPQSAFTTTGAASPITVTGLTPGPTYDATVAAHNSVGYGPESAVSNLFVASGP